MDTEIHISPCGLSLLQMVSFKLVSVTVLMWNISHSLVWLNIWSPSDSAALRGCGPFGASLLGNRSGAGFKVYSSDILPTLSLFPGPWASSLMLLSQALAAPITMPSHCDGLYLQTVNQNKSFLSSLLFGHSRETMATQFSSYTVVCYLGLRSHIPFCFRVHMKGSKRGSREQEWQWEQSSSFRLSLGSGGSNK